MARNRSGTPGQPPRNRPADPAGQPRPAVDNKLKFPHRDPAGRVDTLPDLLVGVIVWLVAALLILLVIEGIGAAAGQGFGHTSGWIAGVLAVWLFAEEYRAWRPTPARVAVAGLGTVVGLAMGAATAGLVGVLPRLVSGFVGVSVAALAYAVLWFFGVRWLARRSGER